MSGHGEKPDNSLELGQTFRPVVTRSPRRGTAATSVVPKLLNINDIFKGRKSPQLSPFGTGPAPSFRAKLQTADGAARGPKPSYRATFTPKATGSKPSTAFQSKTLQVTNLLSTGTRNSPQSLKSNAINTNFNMACMIKKSNAKNKLQGRCQTRFKFLGLKNTQP